MMMTFIANYHLDELNYIFNNSGLPQLASLEILAEGIANCNNAYQLNSKVSHIALIVAYRVNDLQ